MDSATQRQPREVKPFSLGRNYDPTSDFRPIDRSNVEEVAPVAKDVAPKELPSSPETPPVQGKLHLVEDESLKSPTHSSPISLEEVTPVSSSVTPAPSPVLVKITGDDSESPTDSGEEPTNPTEELTSETTPISPSLPKSPSIPGPPF